MQSLCDQDSAIPKIYSAGLFPLRSRFNYTFAHMRIDAEFRAHRPRPAYLHMCPAALIANPAGSTQDGAYLKVIASPDGDFSVTNRRTGETGKYARK